MTSPNNFVGGTLASPAPHVSAPMSHGQVVTESTRHSAVIHDGQLVTRF